MRVNPHGILGVVAILTTLGVAVLRQDALVWTIAGLAIVLYTLLVLILTYSGRDNGFYGFLIILGAHLSIFLLAFSLLLSNTSDLLFTFAISFLCGVVGFTFPRLLFKREENFTQVNKHGVFGIFGLTAAAAVALTVSQAPGFYSASVIIVYCTPWLVYLENRARDAFSTYAPTNSVDPKFSFDVIRLVWSWHLALVFLVLGMLIRVPQSSYSGAIYLIIFVSCISAGVVLPFLLFRNEPS